MVKSKQRAIRDAAIEFINKKGAVDAATIGTQLGVSFFTARKALNDLEDQGVIRGVTLGETNDGRVRKVWILFNPKWDKRIIQEHERLHDLIKKLEKVSERFYPQKQE